MSVVLVKVSLVEEAFLDIPAPSKNSYLVPPLATKRISSPEQIANALEAVIVPEAADVPVKLFAGSNSTDTSKGVDNLSHVMPLNSLRVIR